MVSMGAMAPPFPVSQTTAWPHGANPALRSDVSWILRNGEMLIPRKQLNWPGETCSESSYLKFVAG